MKTTEIFIEQVLIGSLLIVIVILFATQGKMLDLLSLQALDSLKTLHAIGLGAAFVGLAYWIGILYDRIADTLMQDFERHGRLWVALNNHEALNKTYGASDDVFPENELRLAVQAHANLTHQADYLRIRMRLTRALTTMLPALTLVWVLVKLNDPKVWCVGIWGTGIAYSVAFLLKLCKATYRPPRTDDAEGLNKYRCVHKKPDQKKQKDKLTMRPRPDALDSTFLVAIVYFVFCYVPLYISSQLDKPWLLPVVGTGLTCLAAWVWWRISHTFYEYLKTIKGHVDPFWKVKLI